MTMTLYASGASPFARTVLVAAHELGLAGELAVEATPVKPGEANVAYQALNPLRRIPALRTEDGLVIVDSPVICAYLADKAGDKALFAEDAPDRWQVLTDYAIARQMAELAVGARYELAVRPQALRWDDWVDDHFDKIGAALARYGAEPPQRERLTIADIALAVTLGYLDLRYPDYGWREKAPKLAAWHEPFTTRPSFEATTPQG